MTNDGNQGGIHIYHLLSTYIASWPTLLFSLLTVTSLSASTFLPIIRPQTYKSSGIFFISTLIFPTKVTATLGCHGAGFLMRDLSDMSKFRLSHWVQAHLSVIFYSLLPIALTVGDEERNQP